ncbi:hypothetical protein Tsubulata_001813 [Turnera subulata]|uniref:protein-serine/threonine phosphatase n=1 Tax=Turnera subulata TaxID=218843 RepID=A0A9Q0JI22_9ROSI|nr:hypothetical protein Tsubulata_001813 [Turnera subulata]
MADICCGVVSESEAPTPGESSSSRAARRRRMEIRRFKFVGGGAAAPVSQEQVEGGSGGGGGHLKRQRLDGYRFGFPRDCENAVENCGLGKKALVMVDNGRSALSKEIMTRSESLNSTLSPAILSALVTNPELYPKFGFASVCGRRRDMEDAVAIHPCFYHPERDPAPELHYFGVYDGHGCSHVAARCRERLHELVREELEMRGKEAEEVERGEWRSAMETSFQRMDKEVIAWNEGVIGATNCRCELQTPECDAVGSTAVVAIVTPDKIIVANCGDSRAVLCRNGKPVPLSSDHKPDRPDELSRIQEAGGRVIYWDGPRVLGVLAMSRAIGDNYLKPYVSCEPEVTITDRTPEDDCIILASDGLWDVVSNDTACGVARMCLRGKGGIITAEEEVGAGAVAASEMSDKACSDASMLLTKLALARRSADNVSVVVVDLKRDT